MSEAAPIFSDDPEARCGGDRPVQECPLTQSLFERAENADGGLENDTGRLWVVWPDYCGGCVACKSNYQMAVEKTGKVATGKAKITFTKS